MLNHRGLAKDHLGQGHIKKPNMMNEAAWGKSNSKEKFNQLWQGIK